MSVDTLLAHLDGVRRTGPGRWIAKCPAHDDNSPSLAVRELGDGRTLAHCFAGCAVDDVVAAVGLTLSNLMPPRAIGDHIPRERKPFNPSDVLECVALEALIASIAALALARGEPLQDTDHERLLTASARLGAAAEIGGAA